MSATKAKESAQIERARKKIKKQLDEANKKINSETLATMSVMIKKQLARHRADRIDLKERQVTLFDENRHPAKTKSQFIVKLMHKLEEATPSEDKGNLEGRITPFPNASL